MTSRCPLIWAVMLMLAGLARAQSAPTTTATTAPTTQVSPPPIPPGEVATRSESASIKLHSMESNLMTKPMVQSIDDDLPDMTSAIDNHLDDTNQLLASHASLQALRSMQSQWQRVNTKLAGWRGTLAGISKQFGEQINSLDPMESEWKQTLTWSQQVHASEEIGQHASEIIADIEKTRSTLHDRQKEIWAIARKVDDQDARVEGALATVQDARDQAFNRLLLRDSLPIWSARSNPEETNGEGVIEGFAKQLDALGLYIRRHVERLSLHIMGLFAGALGLLWIRKRLRALSGNDPELARATEVFQTPVLTATVLWFVSSIWVYPNAPTLMWSIVGAAGLLPTVLILRRLIDPRVFGILYVLVILFFLDQIRMLLTAQALPYRGLFLVETGGIAVYLLLLTRQLPRKDNSGKPSRKWLAVRIGVLAAAVFFAFAMIANVIGYCGLANFLGDTALSSADLGLVVYTAVRIAQGLVVFLLRASGMRKTHIVAAHEPMLRHRMGVLIGFLGAVFWLDESLDFFNLREMTFYWGARILNATLTVGSISVSLGHVLVFAITIYAAVLVSRFVQFILQEDIFRRLELPGGVPYAITRVLHYVILVWGFCIAVAALGYDMTKFTILAGAFGVGLGFGMQNIVNNFVSGIILLFERPIKVGDVLQLDSSTTGVVEHIGIRASVMLTPEGSEIIIPNGNLLSNQVTNWTLSNGQRAIVLPMNIAPGPDPNKVIEMLINVAKENPRIMSSPAPTAYVTKFTADAFSFELRAWTDQAQTFAQVRSELAMAIYKAAAAAGYTLK